MQYFWIYCILFDKYFSYMILIHAFNWVNIKFGYRLILTINVYAIQKYKYYEMAQFKKQIGI